MRDCEKIAREVFEQLKVSRTTYRDNFEAWYETCFYSCMEEAVRAITCGGCTLKGGSYIEIGSFQSKDGCTHHVPVDEADFIEYYGADEAFNIFLTQEQVENDLIAYFSGGKMSDHYNQIQLELFAEACREWEALPCDPEGANAEQNEAMDELLEEYAEKIMESAL